MSEQQWLRLPVVSSGAEYLVMGYLMRQWGNCKLQIVKCKL